MNEVRLPIKTTRDGNKITKVCVEDIYKMYNRLVNIINDTNENVDDVLDFIPTNYDGYYGKFVVGTGTSVPCITDAFDDTIGNNIAFMKAKLNANIKKRNIVDRICRIYVKAISNMITEREKLNEYIRMDIHGIRNYNPDYLKDFDV